jgi:hypothetical protein
MLEDCGSMHARLDLVHACMTAPSGRPSVIFELHCIGVSCGRMHAWLGRVCVFPEVGVSCATQSYIVVASSILF